MSRIAHFLTGNVIVSGFVITIAAPCFAEQDRPLHEAVREGNLTLVTKLLDEGADINAEVENHLTPIYFAADPNMVDLLLTHKPKLNMRADAQTPLEHAAERFSGDKEKAEVWREIVGKLRNAGAEYTVDAAIYMDDVPYIQEQLEKDDSWVNKCRGSQSVPLRVAARTGGESICKLLLKHKADPNDFEGGCGYPILVDAIDHPPIVKMLIDAGANLRRRITWRGGRTGVWFIGDEATALHFAAQAGNLESCRLLVKAGVDVNAADTEGQTPLHIILRIEPSDKKSFAKIVYLFLENDASLRFTNKAGKTVIDVAKEMESPKDVQRLLKKRETREERRFQEASPD